MRLAKFCLPVIAGLLFASTSSADVNPHPTFSDNMVLQRDVPLTVWGKADPGERVTVEEVDGLRLRVRQA